MQRVLNSYEELAELLRKSGRILFVHGKSAEKFLKLSECLSSSSAEVFHFTDFSPNPKLECAKLAYDVFTSNKCVFILTGGGGTAIDVAKYVKLNNPEATLIAIPTTAGSGSEATRFAVLYEDGKKLSITDDNIIPDFVLFDPELLKYLPEYHRKSSALDALSHSLESFWSVNANSESKEYSSEALSIITRMLEDYPDSYDYETMQKAAYIAGKAINIAQTTAGHAMCYKITSIFGTAHGHSSALCNRVLFPYLAEHMNLNDIAHSMGCDDPTEAVMKYERIFERMKLNVPEANMNQIDELASSVNPERLKNFPVELNQHMIRDLYCKILKVRV